MKKLLSLLLSIALLVTALPLSAAALSGDDAWLDTGEVPGPDGVTYTFSVYEETGVPSPRKYATLLWASPPEGLEALPSALVCPSAVEAQGETLPVLAVGSYFLSSGGETVTSITLPAQLESIEDYAFSGASALAAVVWPETLRSIGTEAFAETGLTALALPNGVESIGDRAFAECPSLASVTLPKNLASLGEAAFTECGALSSVDFSRLTRLETISKEAFHYCALEQVSLPPCVKTVGEAAFAFQIDREGEFPLARVDLGSVEVLEREAFHWNCALAGTLTLPDTLTTLGVDCFAGASITAVKWPDNPAFTTITGFRQCEKLTDTILSSLPDSVDTLGEEAFAGCTGLTEVTIPAHIRVLQYHAFYECENITSLTILPGLQVIENSAFRDCEGLAGQTVTLPRTVSSVEHGAFYSIGTAENPLTVVFRNPDVDFPGFGDPDYEGDRFEYYAKDDPDCTTHLYEVDPFVECPSVILFAPVESSAGEASLPKRYADVFDGAFYLDFRTAVKRQVAFRELSLLPESYTVSGPLPEGVTVTVKRAGEAVPVTVAGGRFSASVEEGAAVAVLARKEGYYDQALARSADSFTADWEVTLSDFEPLPDRGRFLLDLTRDGVSLPDFDGLELTLTQGNAPVAFTASWPYLVVTDPDALSPSIPLTLTVAPDLSLGLTGSSASSTPEEGVFSLALIPWGAVRVTASGSTADSVQVQLFDASGAAVSQGAATAGVFLSDPLPAGTYTVAAFERNGVFSAVSTLSGFTALGLVSGRDYAAVPVTVADGETAAVSLTAPRLDASAFASVLDLDRCGVTLRSDRAVVDQYFDVLVHYALRDESIESANLTFTLPAGAAVDFVCDETRQLSFTGNAVSVDKPAGTLYLTVKCAQPGFQSFGAAITAGGVTLPLGSASVEVRELFVQPKEPTTSTRTGNRAVLLAAPRTRVTLTVSGGGSFIGVTNASGRLELPYDLPPSAVYGQTFALTATAGQAVASGEVAYFPENAVLESLSFVHSGQWVRVIDREGREDAYYTYVATGREQDQYFSFTAEIRSDEALEDVTVLVTMQDASTRAVPMALRGTQDGVATYVGALKVANTEDHVFRDDRIPVGFQVTWDCPAPTLDGSAVYAAAAAAAREKQAAREAALDGESLALTREDLRKLLTDFENTFGSEKDLTRVEEVLTLFSESFGDAYLASPFGDAYRVTDKPGFGASVLTVSQRDQYLREIREMDDLTAAQKAAATADMNAWYEEGQEYLAHAAALEDAIGQAYDLLGQFLGLPKPLREYTGWEEVLQDLGTTVSESTAATPASLARQGYTQLGELWLKVNEDGSFAAAWPGTATLQEDGDAMGEFSQETAGNFGKTAIKDLLEKGAEKLADQVEAHGKEMVDHAQDCYDRMMKSPAFAGNDNFYRRRHYRLDLEKDMAWGEALMTKGKKTVQFLGKATGVYSIYDDAQSLNKNIVDTAEAEADASQLEVLQRYFTTHAVPDGCLEALNAELTASRKLASWLKGKSANLGTNILVNTGTFCADVLTLGGSKLSGFSTWYDIGSTASMGVIDYNITFLRQEIRQLHEKRVALCGDGDSWKNYRRLDPILDPSGVVYEAVETNLLSEVTATVYDVTHGAVWNAGDYDQVNPQVTGADGAYAWDVPLGDWRVDFTKAGYAPASTPTLTVPPPRMGLKTALVSTAAPQVTALNAYPDCVELLFSQYMDVTAPLTVPAGYTYAWADPVPVSDTDPTAYAKVLRLTPTGARPALGETVSVTLSGARNYAGTALPAYSGSAAVQVHPARLVLNYTDRISAGMGESPLPRVTVRVLDSQGTPLSGLTVTGDLESSLFASLTAVSAVTDEAGLAVFELEPLLPGVTAVSFGVEGASLTAALPLEVTAQADQPARPTAVLGDNTFGEDSPKENYAAVPAGTKLTLATATEGAVLYYTTDGTCPCQNTASRQLYTGPVTVTEDTYFRIAAYKPGQEYSQRLNLHVTVSAQTQFVDVKDSDWFYDAVYYCAGCGYFNGMDATHFGPKATMDRAMFATVLWRLAGQPDPASGENPFTDVPEGQWYTTAILWAAGEKIIEGYGSGRFGRTDPVTREQMVTLFWRYRQRPRASGEALSAFRDADKISSWAKDAFAWAVSNGVVNGKGNGQLDPKGTATRAEVAQIVTNYDRNLAS